MKPSLNTHEAFLFYTSSNRVVSGNSAVNLLVIAFSPNKGHFLLKSLRPDLVLVEKVRMVASY